MDVRPIRNEVEYDAALAEVDQYFVKEPEPGIPEGDRFEVLLALIGAYEQKHWRIEAPDAVSAIKEVMARKNYTQSDLARLLGSAPRASEILNGKRGLTMEQARLLHAKWDVPAESLLIG
ncbi:MAG TPA: helix-turn-helix domain-containing protein [Stellaceae bacterium]|nr:helix-turn-helix domain-containing protein [Stellaceae bacterium]